MRIQSKGLNFYMFHRLALEAGTPEFGVKGGDPFLFKGDRANIIVLFKGRTGARKIATLLCSNGEVAVQAEPTVGQQVKAHLRVVAVAVADAAKRAHELHRERQRALMAEGLELMGPRDQNKKLAVLRTPRFDGLRLAAFGGYFNAALPAPLRTYTYKETQPSYFNIEIAMIGEKETHVPVLLFRSSGNRLETECLVEGEKARVEFMEHVFDRMRARRDRVTQDPDIQTRMQDVMRSVPQTWFDKDSGYTRKSGVFNFINSDHGMLMRTTPFHVFQGVKQVSVELGGDLSAIVNVQNGRGEISGFTFKGEPISGEAGFLSGLSETRPFWSKACALTLRARPDLLTREASLYLEPTEMLNEDEDLNVGVLEAIEMKRSSYETETPIM